MDMNINVTLAVGTGDVKKEVSLSYDEAKELYQKLKDLFYNKEEFINIFEKKFSDSTNYSIPYIWCKYF